MNSPQLLTTQHSLEEKGASPRSPRSPWRSWLLGTVTAGMMFLSYGRYVRAQSTTSPPFAVDSTPCSSPGGTNVTCTGDVSGGIDINNGTTYSYTTLTVKELTANIESGNNSGIYFRSDTGGDLTIYSDTGAYTITTQGMDANGIRAYSRLSSGDAGAVTVMHTGDIRTTEDSASGILAASLSEDGNAGEVKVTLTGDIETKGDLSTGIFARSDTLTGTGDARPVTVIVTEDAKITALGATSTGIYASSFSVFGNTDEVNVTVAGDITTTQADSHGIYAVSLSGVGNADSITVTLDGSTIEAGGVGVRFRYGTTNSLNIYNAVSISSASGVAIDALGDANETINNYGALTIKGNVNLGDGIDTINNDGTLRITGDINLGDGNDFIYNDGTLTMIGDIDLGGGNGNAMENKGLFNSGNNINLGGGNEFENLGTWAPGGNGTVQTTTVTGEVGLWDSSILSMDIDGNAADRIHVTQDTELNGLVVPNLVSLAPNTGPLSILETGGTLTDSGIEAQDTATVDYELTVNTQDLELSIVDVDFAIEGLNRNQTSLATHLNGVYEAGGGAMGPLLGTVGNLMTLSEVASALDLLSPEIYVDTQAAALFSSNAFSDNLLSCRVNGQGVSFINKEGDCWWLNTTGRFLTRDKTFEMIGYDETVGTFSAGRQLALGPVWRLSVGMGYQHSTLTTNTNATSDSNQIQGGFALKYNPGALLLAAVVNGGYGWYDTTRPMAFGSFAGTAQGDQNVSLFAARLYGSHVFGSPNLFIKPILSGAATRLGLGDVTETGAGSANLRVSGQSETIYSISPALEAGTQGRLGDQTIVRPYVRAGMTWFSQQDVSAAATFVDSPSGVAPFSIVTTLDQTWADVAGGLELITAKNTNMRLYYDGHLAQEFTIHSVGLKLGMSF